MNTQVPLQNSLFRLAVRVNNELVGSMSNTERMIRELFAIFTGQVDDRQRLYSNGVWYTSSSANQIAAFALVY